MIDPNAMTAEELAGWDERTAPGREADDAMADPVWRLANLYVCLNANGQVVKFVPTPEQRLVIWCIHARGWRRILIPKARQLGMSLVLCLIGLDFVLFKAGAKAALVDKSEDDAKKKLREKVKLAWEGIDPAIAAVLPAEATANAISFGAGLDASTYEADVSFRGGTVQFLHVSEWGEIQMRQRERSREIRDGSLPAAERAQDGIIVVETTWHGGLDGELGPYVHEALETPEAAKGPKSWRILFFPWWGSTAYQSDHGYVDPESRRYFEKLAAEYNIHLTDAQRAWYSSERRTRGARAMRSQFPSVMSECWESMPEGAIYGSFIERARSEQRIKAYTTDGRHLVHTFWDLGHPLNTVCWLAQITPEEIRVLDVVMEIDITLEARAALLAAKGWTYGNHFLPHDAGIRQTSGLCQADEFRRVFASVGGHVRIVPRVADVWQGINGLRAIFPRLVFRDPECRPGIEHLARYHAVRETSTGIARDEPVHDRYSHAADALRQLAQALDGHMLVGGHSVAPDVRRQLPTATVIRARCRI
jgi:hypothetical protein